MFDTGHYRVIENARSLGHNTACQFASLLKYNDGVTLSHTTSRIPSRPALESHKMIAPDQRFGRANYCSSCRVLLPPDLASSESGPNPKRRRRVGAVRNKSLNRRFKTDTKSVDE